MEKTFINLTPHDVALNNGKIYKASGVVARVADAYGEINDDCICKQTFGDIVNLPEPKDGTVYIVSAIVLSAVKAKGGREDVVAPATGHPESVRENGFIKSVRCFVQ